METAPSTRTPPSDLLDDRHALVRAIRGKARQLGFQGCGVASPDLPHDEERLMAWLRDGRQGTMGFMGRHGRKRARPRQLVPGTRSVIVVRMDYSPPEATPAETVLEQGERGYVARYAVGRDYHRIMRRRLQRLADWLEGTIGAFGYRAFVDSAPVLEKALARNAGLGWIGKNTLVLSRRAGSWFFLGELFTDLELPVDGPVQEHCGSCRACMDVCPTGAITGPYQLDARRCIAYLTIEHEGSIPETYRKAIGNRVFGCDDCQLVCPWNRYAGPADDSAFQPRHGLDAPQLAELFAWNEETFLERTAGSAIRRLGHERWLRNLAVALGNAPTGPEVIHALEQRRDHPSELVREHTHWALAQHGVRRAALR